MGNNCIEVVNSSEQLLISTSKSLKNLKAKDQCQGQDQDQLDASFYNKQIIYILWHQNNQDDILFGALFDKDLQTNPYRFYYGKKGNENGYERDGNLKKFNDKFISIQQGRDVESKLTLNDISRLYQAENDPKSFLIQLFGQNLNSEEKIRFEQNIKFEKNESYQKINAINKTQEYTICYQNYFYPNQLLFESQNQAIYNYNWDKKQIKKVNYSSIYQYAIILKDPIKNKDEILSRCNKYQSSSEFLKSEVK